MSDPRNVAHDKKVKQEKDDEAPVAAKAAAQPKEKAAAKKADAPAASQGSPDLEQSVAVLSKLKEMEFHSRANIETLAELTLTIDDELKQKEFSDPIGGLYSAQDQFQTKITELIQSYESHVETLKPAV